MVEKRITGIRNSRYKGPEGGTQLIGSRSSKDATIARREEMKTGRCGERQWQMSARNVMQA